VAPVARALPVVDPARGAGPVLARDVASVEPVTVVGLVSGAVGRAVLAGLVPVT
jgi:hypothetical protein